MHINSEVINQWNSKGETRDLNCWGATALYFKLISAPKWLSQADMTEFLNIYFYEIPEKDLQPNDVYALFSRQGELIHTSIHLEHGSFWHKPGGWKAEYCNRARIDDIYIGREPIFKGLFWVNSAKPKFYRRKIETEIKAA